MSLSIDRNTYISHFIGLLFCLMALSDITHSRELIFVTSLLCLVAFLSCFPMKEKNHFKEAMLFILVLLVMSLVNLLFTQNGWGGSVTLVAHLLLTYIYFQAKPKIMTFWIVLAYVITIGFIAINLFVLKVNANEIYEELSRNHAGFAVVFWTAFLLFHVYVNHNRFIILIPLLGLTLSFFLFGRTSLLVSALLLALVFFFKFKDNLTLRIITTSAFGLTCLLLWLNFGEVLIAETNFNQGLDTPRWRLWSIYFEHLNFLNFLTGVDVTTLPMYDTFSGNPHNAFIKFHSRVGIGSLIFSFLFIISLYKYILKKEFYVFWILILLSIRAFFDSDILIGNFDFIYFIITFYWIKTE